MSDQDIDVDELRTDLDQIKEAMGIAERYDGATTLWLFFGLVIPVGAGLSQYVHLERLPQWYHPIVWTVVIGGGCAVFFALADDDYRLQHTPEGRPNLLVQFAIVYLATVPLQSIAHAYAGEVGYVAESAMVLSIIVVMIGIGYGVLGASLRGYNVRRRDRWVFYVGAVWMVVLGVAIPQSDFLETWAYAVYGGTYFVYAMVAYFALRTGGDGER